MGGERNEAGEEATEVDGVTPDELQMERKMRQADKVASFEEESGG